MTAGTGRAGAEGTSPAAGLVAAAITVAVAWSTFELPLSGDATAHVYLAYSFVWHGSATVLDYVTAPQPFVFMAIPSAQGPVIQYVPGNALLFSPVALVGGLLGFAPGSTAMAQVATHIVASLGVAISAGLLFLLLRDRTGARAAAFLTAAYAMGTGAFAVSSQLFLQHAPTAALTAASLWLLLKPPARAPANGVVGLLLSLAVLVRPMNAIFGAALFAYIALRRRNILIRACLWTIPPMLFLAIYDTVLFGAPWSLPGAGGVAFAPPLEGMAGLLISPSRGLLVYSPFLAAGLVALGWSWRWRADDRVVLLRCGSLAFLGVLLLFGTYRDWIGGWSYGGRYLLDLLPLYILAIGEAWRHGWFRTLAARALLSAAIGWSILVYALGAGLEYFYWNGRQWDATPDILHSRSRVWDWAATQWQWVLARAVLAPPAALFAEAVVLSACLVAFALLGRTRTDPPRRADQLSAPGS